MRSEEGRYEVQSWEKIKTPKGEFDAFKLVMTMSVLRGPKPLAPTEVRTTHLLLCSGYQSHCFFSRSRN